MESSLDPVPRGDCFKCDCPARAVFSHLTGRWGSLVLAALRDAGILRFSALRQRIGGVSEKMLAQTLRDLERDGLILRTSRPVVPPYVDYRLTPVGEGIAVHLGALIEYVEANIMAFVGAQAAHDAGERRSG